MADLPGDFTLLDRYGARAPLRRFEVSHADKTLGIFISMDGNETAEYDHLVHTSKTFALQMRAAKCTKNQALYTFSSSFMKSIEYAMPVTQFSEDEWRRIISPALVPTLQSSGIAGNAPRASLFGSALYQGFDLMNPFFNQEISHLMTLLQESVSGSQTGLLLRLSAESLRLEIGVPFTLGECDYTLYSPYVTDCWYKSVWKFAFTHSISIREDFPDPPPLRHKDSYLMSHFVSAGFRGQDLALLNLIRLRLRAITVSDIATPDGLSITHQAFLLQHSNHLRHCYDWPRDLPVSPRQLVLWQQALRRALLCPTRATTARTLRFRCRVGPWLLPTLHSDLWPWFHSLAEDRLYQRLEGNRWQVWAPFSWGRYCRADIVPSRPVDASLLSVSPRGDMVKKDNAYPWWYEATLRPPDRYDPRTTSHPCLIAAFQASIDSAHVLLDEILLPIDGAVALAQAISAGTAAAVSDGSFCPVASRGSSAFTIATAPDIDDPKLNPVLEYPPRHPSSPGG